jgi:hypothetical protein
MDHDGLGNVLDLLLTERELVFLFYNKLHTTALASVSDKLIMELHQACLIDACWMCCGRGPFNGGKSMCSHSEADPANQL